MILSGKQIKEELGKGLDISPFNESRLNPNSYNLRLADELLIYDGFTSTGFRFDYHEDDNDVVSLHNCLDMKKNNAGHIVKIPNDGVFLIPGNIYLGRTMEYTKTSKFVPMLEGISSVGRLGINIHATAGFGDVGFEGYWTLELSCVQPIIIYPGVDICQIYYHTIELDDDPILYKSDKYQQNSGIQPSMMWKDFLKE